MAWSGEYPSHITLNSSVLVLGFFLGSLISLTAYSGNHTASFFARAGVLGVLQGIEVVLEVGVDLEGVNVDIFRGSLVLHPAHNEHVESSRSRLRTVLISTPPSWARSLSLSILGPLHCAPFVLLLLDLLA